MPSDRDSTPQLNPSVAVSSATAMAKTLLESDRVYFELGANLETISGVTIAAMPGLTHIPAGCVGHRIDATKIVGTWNSWIDRLERHLKQIGCLKPRLYLDEPLPELERALFEIGYRPQIEVGLLDVPSATQLARNLGITLHPVLEERDWQRKLELHSASEQGPDGHSTPPQNWVELERRKCETGMMRVYLIYRGDNICGTVGALEVDNLLRLKNLVICPQWRRRGIALATVLALKNEAIRLKKQALGCFALLGHSGQRVYERAGLSVVTQQTEWYRV